MRKLRIPLRIVFYKVGEAWMAHCLEMDVVGDGSTRDEAFKNLNKAIALQVAASIDFGNEANIFSPADSKLFEMFAAGKDVANGEMEVHIVDNPRISIEGPELREFDDADADSQMACA